MKIDPKIMADYLVMKTIMVYLGCILALVILVVLGIVFLFNKILAIMLFATLYAVFYGIQYRIKYHGERICRDATSTLGKFIDNYLSGFQKPNIPGSDIEALSEILQRDGISVPSTFILMTAVNRAVEKERLTRFAAHLKTKCPSLPERPGLYDVINAYLEAFVDNLYDYFDLLGAYANGLGMEIKEKDLIKMVLKEADVRRVNQSIQQAKS